MGFFFIGTLNCKMVYECFWLVMLILNCLQQLWTLRLVVFTTQYIYKACVICANMSSLLDPKNILTTAMAVFFLSVEEAQTHLHRRNIPTFILIFLQNIFVKLFKDSYLFLLIPFSAKQVSKMNWKVFRVNMRKIGIMMFGGQTR